MSYIDILSEIQLSDVLDAITYQVYDGGIGEFINDLFDNLPEYEQSRVITSLEAQYPDLFKGGQPKPSV